MVLLTGVCGLATAQDYPAIPTDPKPGDALLASYFEQETARLTEGCLAEIQSAEDWQKAVGGYREELFEMLGMPPDRPRTELQAKTTGAQIHEDVTIENVVFQSRPGLYVTANFYRPTVAPETPLPAILYVCGHSPQSENGIHFGNKTAYHHHGMWFARHGYVCLMIDTIQLGEIEGTHHGTYRENRWWWNSRGYTPAGVEAWNGIRALDYLEGRPEVDASRLGLTGRSGGGAYTMWVAALDERVKVAVPVAGVTTLHDHVVGGVVEGHCDCMFHVNTYQWDFAKITSLIAPRALLIANSDKDTIFPLEGVVDVYTKTRRIYQLLGKEDQLGLAITEGPHQDTQPLRTVAFEWFERHLKGRERSVEIDTRAPKVLDRTTMKALEKTPYDEIVSSIDESFVESAPAPELPVDQARWDHMREQWMRSLREKVFRAWPDGGDDLEVREIEKKTDEGVTLIRYDFLSQAPFRLPLVVALPAGEISKVELRPVGEEEWQKWLAEDGELLKSEALARKTALVICPPRGIGPTAWTDDPRETIHLRRRFMLLGQTLDGMRVWDIRRALAATRNLEALRGMTLTLHADHEMADHALYASLFEPGITELRLSGLENSHQKGTTDYLNILRFLDLPVTVALAAEGRKVEVNQAGSESWKYAQEVARRLGWGTQMKVLSSDK